MLTIIEATFKLGLPLVLMSWWFYSWLYRKGLLDRNSTRKQAGDQLKQMRKEAKQNTASSKDLEHFWLDKWMFMGGGFYGLAALWTLIILELKELIRFLIGLPAFFANFTGGPVDLFILLIINQVQNLISAFVWFNYWGEGFSLVWVVVAYLGYLMGRQVAKKYDASILLRDCTDKGRKMISRGRPKF